jgi:predicted PurR-regulated permease PerM
MQQTPTNDNNSSPGAEHAAPKPRHISHNSDDKKMPRRMEDLFSRQQLIRSIYLFLTGLALIISFFIVDNLASIKVGWNGIISLVTPFIWGISIAYILMPLLNWLESLLRKSKFLDAHRKLCRGISIIITMLLVFFGLGVFFSLVIPELVNSVISLFNIITNSSYDWLLEYVRHAQEYLKNLGLTNLDFEDLGWNQTTMGKLPDNIRDYLQNPEEYLTSFVSYVLALCFKAGMSLKNILMAIIVSVYMMIGKETFLAQSRKLIFAFTERSRAEHFIDFCSRTNRIFSGFISGKLLDSFIIGIICFALMKLLRLEYSMLISIIIGVTNCIPFFGPFIGAIPSILLLIIVSPKQALIFTVMILALQQFDGNILGPKILGGATGLTSFWVIFAVIVMGGMLGVVGMFIGVPIFATIYMILKNTAENRLRKKDLPTETQSYQEDYKNFK